MAGTELVALIADDHASMRKWIRTAIGEYGKKAIRVLAEAADGTAALELARMHRPDLVFLDIEMAGMSGLEATRRLRRELPATQVVIVSLHEEDAFRRAAHDAGAAAYVAKARMLADMPGAIDVALAQIEATKAQGPTCAGTAGDRR